MHDSSLMGLLPGDCFTVADLLYGLMLPSGNDAALALGRHLTGSDGEFVAAMNTLLAPAGPGGQQTSRTRTASTSPGITPPPTTSRCSPATG